MSEQPALRGICSDKNALAVLLLQVLFSLWQDKCASFDDATALLFPLLFLVSQDHRPTYDRGVTWRGEERMPNPCVSAPAMNSEHVKAQLHGSDQ